MYSLKICFIKQFADISRSLAIFFIFSFAVLLSGVSGKTTGDDGMMMYQKYIDGEMEISDIKEMIKRQYMKGENE